MTSGEVEFVSSDLARTELMRAVRRASPEHAPAARVVLESMILMQITSEICERAALLDPTILRSLDAIHIATALDLGDDLDHIITYDERMADAANAIGIAVLSPACARKLIS